MKLLLLIAVGLSLTGCTSMEMAHMGKGLVDVQSQAPTNCYSMQVGYGMQTTCY
jgi:hypothetical protein